MARSKDARKAVYGIHLLLLSLIVVGILTFNTAYAQEEPRVVDIRVDKTTVYRGYQWVEVTAFIFVPSGGSLEALEGKAVLRAGIVEEVQLAYVRPRAPVTVTVDGETFRVRDLLVARVPIPFGAVAGRGELEVSIMGSVKVGDQSFDISTSRTFTLAILDHIVVDNKRVEALVKFENARNTVSIVETVGGLALADLRSALEEVQNLLAEADTQLYSFGNVEQAISMYDEVSERAASIASEALLTFIAASQQREAELASRLASIEGTLNEHSSRLDAAEESLRSLSGAIEDLNGQLTSLAQAFQDFGNSVNSYLANLNDNIKRTNERIDKLAEEVNNNLRTLASNVEESLSSMSESVSSLSGSLSQALIVIAAVLLIGLAIVGFARK